jgi:PAS domain S-box-containing protein
MLSAIVWGQASFTWPQFVLMVLSGAGPVFVGLGAWVLNLLNQKKAWEREKIQFAEQAEQRRQVAMDAARDKLNAEYDHFFAQIKQSNTEYQNTINGLRKELAIADQECDERLRAMEARIEDLRHILESERQNAATRISKLQIILGELQAENSLQRTQMQEIRSGMDPVLVTSERQEGIIFTNAEGQIGWANPRAHNLFKYPPGSLIGRNVRDLVPPVRRPEYDRRRELAMQNSNFALELARVRATTGWTRTGVEVPVNVMIQSFELDERRVFRAVVWLRSDMEPSSDAIPVHQPETGPNSKSPPIPVVITNPPDQPVPAKVVAEPSP